jgi:cell division protein FtsI/penicillin-binding protein 2
MRRVLWLAFAALLAGAGLYASSGGAGPSAPPPAEIAGAPLEERPAASVQRPAADPEPLAASRQPLAIDFDHIKLAGDHYEAPMTDGRTAKLTLDPDLQQLAEKLLDEARAPKAAIVVMAPDGKILALAGRRTDDPKGGKAGIADASLAIEPWAPAASVFKLVTASALVASGTDGDTNVCYHGGIRSVTESNLRDDKRDNVCQSLTFGVAHSNNAIVGKLAYQKLEPSALAQTAKDLGLASPPKDAMALHAPLGEITLPETKDLDFAKAAAGFQGSKLSALGGALLATTFADGGEQPTPRIVDDAPSATHRVLPPAIAKEVSKMMLATCEYGSASRAFGRHRAVAVAGKTGTLTRTDPFYMEHSWFVGYAPAEKPQVVVSVVLGNPESWHLRAQEAARRLIDRATRRAPEHGATPSVR